MIEPVTTCVVEIGNPKCVPTYSVDPAESWAAKPCSGCSL
jgi:hypothetical protein